jgi:hypothetical protein
VANEIAATKVTSKGGHEIELKSLDFDLRPLTATQRMGGIFAPMKDPPRRVIVVAVFEFDNDPPMDGQKFVAGLLRGLESIE